jgi:hypothetical protein
VVKVVLRLLNEWAQSEVQVKGISFRVIQVRGVTMLL